METWKITTGIGWMKKKWNVWYVTKRKEHYINEYRISKGWFDEIVGEGRDKVTKLRDEKRERERTEIWKKVEAEHKKLQKEAENQNY